MSYLRKSKDIVLKYYFGIIKAPDANSTEVKVSDFKCT